MQLTPTDLVLVTGATGLVGSHFCEALAERGVPTRAIVRADSDTALLAKWNVQTVPADMTDAASLRDAVEGVTAIVHCAAKVGDWGPVDGYRRVNVAGTQNLCEAAAGSPTLKRFIQISSLGVYAARDHFGTDESAPLNTKGIDGYTLTKVESELVVRRFMEERKLPTVILRPGFIYGPRDRTVLPRLLEKLRQRKVKFLGSGEQLMNNTFVGNLVDAICLAIENDAVAGETYNITDGRLVSKREFMHTVAAAAGLEPPQKSVPLPVAKAVARGMEAVWKLLRKKQAPLLSSARIKFLGLNLDFSIQKAKSELGYAPSADFTDAMTATVRQHLGVPMETHGRSAA